MNSDSQRAEKLHGGIAVEDLYARYRIPLLRYFIRRGHLPDVAEDCVEDMFVRIARSELSKIDNIEAYFFTFAANVAVDYARKMRVRHVTRHDPINKIDIESRRFLRRTS